VLLLDLVIINGSHLLILVLLLLQAKMPSP
jgi:hypothetical protein